MMVLYFKGETMNQIFIFLVAAVFLVGCGDTNTKPTPTPPPPSSNEDMILSESYTIYSGDQIVKSSDPTSLRISHIDFQDQSTVTLLEGSATIIRK